MLALHRVMLLPDVGTCARLLDLWHTRLRVRVVRSTEVGYDDALVPSVPKAPNRRRMIAVLEGRALLRQADRVRELQPGGMLIAPQDAASMMRSEGRCFRMLAFDWADDLFTSSAPDSTGGISHEDVERLSACADRLAASWCEPFLARIEIARAWNVLRGAGAGLEPLEPEALREHVPAAFARLSNALCDAAVRLDTGPMLVDIEHALARSRRQLARSFHAMAAAYGLDAATWRQTLELWRLQTGIVLMTHPAATTAAVSRALGYGSPATLCHSFERAGLPSPGSIRRLLDMRVAA